MHPHLKSLRISGYCVGRIILSSGSAKVEWVLPTIDTVLNRPVALKVITGEFLRSQQARYRFLREAQAAALIHHPHVATIFHFGEEGDRKAGDETRTRDIFLGKEVLYQLSYTRAE
jgi:serine/threonine protein kinase